MTRRTTLSFSSFDEAKNSWEFRSGFPLRHLDKTWRDLEVRNDKVFAYLQTIDPKASSTPELVVLHGGRGCGKTQLATTIAREWHFYCHSTAYTTAVEMFSEIKASFDAATGGHKRGMASFLSPTLLVIDEVNGSVHSEWEQATLTSIIDRRYRDMKLTILVSNLDLAPLKEFLGPSVCDRVRECGAFVRCEWASFRGSTPPKQSPQHPPRQG